MRRILAISIGVMLVFGVVGIASGAGKEPQEKQKVGQEVSPPKPDLPEEASEKAKVKLEKVWERKFDEEIEDVAFEESEITVREAIKMGIKGLAMEKPRKRIRVPYSKIVVTRRSIKFLDKLGKIKRKRLIRETIAGKQCTKLKFSKNKKYIGISEQTFGDEAKEGTKFIILNQDGQILWSLDNLGATYIHPSPNGKYAIGLGLGLHDPYLSVAPLFYNSSGLFKHEKDWPEHLEVREIDFTADGSFFALTATQKGGKIEKIKEGQLILPTRKGFLILINEKGDKIWQRDLGSYTTGKIRILDNCEFIAVTASQAIFEPSMIEFRPGKFRKRVKGMKNYLLLFNKAGSLLLKEEVPAGNEAFEFSSDGKFLFAVFEGTHYLFESSTGNVLWKYVDEEHDLFGTRIVTTPNFDFIAVVSRSRIMKGLKMGADIVYVFTKNGEKIWTQEFTPGYLSYSLEPPYKPNIGISSDGTRIIFGTKSGVEIYQNPFVKNIK